MTLYTYFTLNISVSVPTSKIYSVVPSSSKTLNRSSYGFYSRVYFIMCNLVVNLHLCNIPLLLGFINIIDDYS